MVAREVDLNARIAADAGDYALLASLSAELDEVSAERESLEVDWLEAAELLE